MSVPNHNFGSKKPNKDNSRNSSGSGGGNGEQGLVMIKCPRCESPNTKFCYYNNYSLSQPRHFCKTCRRYWTKGGALRNVPIGGGCRKNKKLTKSETSSENNITTHDDHGLKFLHPSSSMDFQLGGSGSSSFVNQFPPFGPTSSSGAAAVPSLFGFNYHSNPILEMNPVSNNNISSSIESLSSLNLDLHWKLQQQRLSMFTAAGPPPPPVEKPQPILFQNLEISKSHHHVTSTDPTTVPTEWFFGNSYGAGANTNTNAVAVAGNNWNNGVQAWTDLNDQYFP